MLTKFNNSFYGIWFSSLPEEVVCGAIREMENEFKSMKRDCPALYDEYIVLSAVKFLLTFFDVSGVTVEIDGESVALKSLSETGATAYVKKDSIDSNVSREYFKPTLPEGFSFEDFPAGRIASRIAHIETTCKKAGSLMRFRTGSNNPNRGCTHDLGNRPLSSGNSAHKKCK